MFDTAVKFIEAYRARRMKQLDNQERMRWFTAPVATLKDLLEKFSSDTENQEWSQLYQQDKEGEFKQQALQLKIHFLAGCRRDLRIMLASSEADVRTAVDWDRFEFMKLNFHKQKTQEMKQVIDQIKTMS